MYLIIYQGFEMKAQKEKDIKTWLQVNSVNASFSWADLRSEGIAVSLCSHWTVEKIDGRTVTNVDWLSNYGWIGTLVSLTGICKNSQETAKKQ